MGPKVVSDLTPQEVALLADVPPRSVRKAIEEGVVSASTARVPAFRRPLKTALDADAAVYLAVMRDIPSPVPLAAKIRIANWLRKGDRDGADAHLPLAGPLSLDLAKLRTVVRQTQNRIDRYRNARTQWIVSDDSVLGGTPVLKGTRISVYSILGRVEHGDTIEDILAENPDLPRTAIEAALIFAKANPLRGRPRARPWRPAA